MTTNHISSHLSDRELLDATGLAAVAERGATAELIALLAEVDARRLYLGQGCSSLFTYCTQVLCLSEHAAYHRIEAARAAVQFPALLDLLADGSITLTTVALLRPHLTSETCVHLTAAARHKSKREVEQLVAGLAPPESMPAAAVRKLPTPAIVPITVLPAARPPLLGMTESPSDTPAATPIPELQYQLKVTLTVDAHAKLRRAQDLMRHSIPNGDPTAIVERALTMLVGHLERTKFANTSRSRSIRVAPTDPRRRSRHVPAAVKREVWARDQGRCAFKGPGGRCAETSFLEFHHVVPFADGGPTTTANLELRCRAHNAFEAERLELSPFVRTSDLACRD